VTRYLLDTNIISGVVKPQHCVVATDNEGDFAGLEVVNPLRGF